MTEMQVRNVPPTLERELRKRSARAGVSLNDYVLGELARAVSRPSLDELRDRIARYSGSERSSRRMS